MKIFAIGRNYKEHAHELGNEVPEEPVIFLKPETAVIRNNGDFYYPDFSKDIHYEVEILLLVSKEGKNIEKKFAHLYYDSIGVGIDFTARDLQQKLKSKGLPWEISKAFNGSAPVSSFLPKEQFVDLKNIDFHLSIDNTIKQKGNTQLLIFDFDYIISYLSKFFTLKKGDIIFTGTPSGVGPIQIGNVLEAFIGEQKMLHVEIK